MAHKDEVADNEPGVAMVLGKLPVLECPIDLDNGRAGDTALAVRSGGGCIDIFPLDCHFSSSFPLSLSGGGAMVLGNLPVPGRPTVWMTVGQWPIALAVGVGRGCLDIFTVLYPFLSSSSLSAGDGPI